MNRGVGGDVSILVGPDDSCTEESVTVTAKSSSERTDGEMS